MDNYSFILVKTNDMERVIIDRLHYKIISFNTYNNTIKDVTGEVLKFYNKDNTIGNEIFKMFISGGDNLNDSVIDCSNTSHSLPIPFSLENYYNVVNNSLHKREFKKVIIIYDENNKNRFIIKNKKGDE